MKKILIAIFILNLFVLVSYARDDSLKIVWENTTVKIPIGGDIDEYSLLPKSNLYVNVI